MPRYPGYRFAREFHRDGRPVDNGAETSFLRVFRNEAALLRAGLHPNAEASDDDHHWGDGITLTEGPDALNALADHPGNEILQQEQLLVAAYHRLDHDRTTPRNVYVPAELRPWGGALQAARSGCPSVRAGRHRDRRPLRRHRGDPAAHPRPRKKRRSPGME